MSPESPAVLHSGPSMLMVLLITYVAVINEFGDMLACDVKRFIVRNRVWMRHVGLFGVILLVRVLPEERDATLWELMRDAVVLYALLIMSTKCSMWTFVPAMLCILAYVAMWIRETRTPKQQRDSRVKLAFQYAAYCFVVGGFAMYALKQTRDHGRRFRLSKFLFTQKPCRAVLRGVDEAE
jgi:hypothetical protein